VFHDLTTFVPTTRRSPRREASLLSWSAVGAGSWGDGGAEGPLTEVAVGHVLASVTEKAKELLRPLITHQLTAITEGGAGLGAGADDNDGKAAPGMHRNGMQYELPFQVARQQFIATNDTAVRALLGEFMDHGVVVSVQAPDILISCGYPHRTRRCGAF